MTLSRLRSLFGRRSGGAARPSRARLTVEAWPAIVYAIGDVHGCLAELRLLEQAIIDDAAAVPGEKWIVLLGDYVDRGPDSAGVLDLLTAAPPTGFHRICLVGNHEVMMLDFLTNPRRDAPWLDFGGLETLQSYGISPVAATSGRPAANRAVLNSHIPTEHVDFLTGLPLLLTLPGVIFVHAGLRPGRPLEQQNEDDLLWIRKEFFAAPPADWLVVHGHTPEPEPVITEHRIGIDTAAFATGRLTAVRLREHEPPRIISVQGSASPGYEQ